MEQNKGFPLSSSPPSEFSAQTKRMFDKDQLETFLTLAINPLGGMVSKEGIPQTGVLSVFFCYLGC